MRGEEEEEREKNPFFRFTLFRLCLAFFFLFVVSHLSIRARTELRRDADSGVVSWHSSCTHFFSLSLGQLFTLFFSFLRAFSQKKQRKIAKLPVNGNHTDPFGDDEGEVARISKELEAKYVSDPEFYE